MGREGNLSQVEFVKAAFLTPARIDFPLTAHGYVLGLDKHSSSVTLVTMNSQ